MGEAEGLVAGRDYTTISTTEKLTSSLLQNINLDELAGSLLQESGIKNVAKLVVTGVAATVVLALVSGGWLGNEVKLEEYTGLQYESTN